MGCKLVLNVIFSLYENKFNKMNIPIENNKRPDLKLNDPNNLFLIDGSGYIFRAFYGLPSMSNGNGVPVNAVFGYTKMLLKLIDDFKPIYAAVIFDVARKTFRNDLYDLYKANRSDPPDELIPQFSIIRDATNAIGLPVVEMEGYEADDLIATYSDIASKMNKNVIICLLYTSPSPRDRTRSRMPSSA